MIVVVVAKQITVQEHVSTNQHTHTHIMLDPMILCDNLSDIVVHENRNPNMYITLIEY